jgi:membrane protease YdiL (CAAX protease family)
MMRSDGTTRRDTTKPQPPVGTPRSWARFLAAFGLLYAVLIGTSSVDATGRWGLAILAAVMLTAVIVENVHHRTTLPVALRRLGLGRPGGRALIVAAGVSGLVLLVYPLSAAVSGAPMRLRPDWPWLLIGLFAFHGLAEELVWRGYAFRRLRDGRTFWAAMCWTMPLIAATHLTIVFTLGLAVGLGAMLVAAVTSISFGYLYETGHRTIWAPALVHTAIDSFKLFVIPAVALSTFPLLLTIISILIPLTALAVPRMLLAIDHPKADKRPEPTPT